MDLADILRRYNGLTKGDVWDIVSAAAGDPDLTHEGPRSVTASGEPRPGVRLPSLASLEAPASHAPAVGDDPDSHTKLITAVAERLDAITASPQPVNPERVTLASLAADFPGDRVLDSDDTS